jgi:hypothetical protein
MNQEASRGTRRIGEETEITDMKHEPQIQQRAAQPYVTIRMPETMEGLAEAVDTGFPEVFGWLAKHGVTPAGPPFIRYLVIDMATELEIELAVPIGGEADVREGSGFEEGLVRVALEVLSAHDGPFCGRKHQPTVSPHAGVAQAFLVLSDPVGF